MPRRRESKPWDNFKTLSELYTDKEMSYGQIAQMFNTHSNSVRRACKKHGIPSRDKSEAQRNFLEKFEHPMLGRPRTEDEKKNISKGIQEHWDSLSDAEVEALKAEMSERARAKWDWMSEEEKQETIQKMHKANREKAGEGSANENMVAQMLADMGHVIYRRTKDYSPKKEFEIDIAIPALRIAVEWDGAAHFKPIYGDDVLQKTMEKDKRKDAALMSHGWRIIRVRDHSTTHSLAFCQRAVDLILSALDTVVDGAVSYIDAI